MRLHYILFFLFFPVLHATAQNAADILENAKKRLPVTPFEIHGGISLRSDRGRILRKVSFSMLLEWGATPPRAVYTIIDDTRQPVERMTISYPPDKGPLVEYQQGSPLEQAPAPSLETSIQAMGISWLDLSLAFLWWKNPEYLGEEDVKGRSCHVLALVPPDDTSRLYVKTLLWIDKQSGMLLKVEIYDINGRITRCMSVRRFKKINDTWMIREMELSGDSSLNRTTIYVNEVEQIGQ